MNKKGKKEAPAKELVATPAAKDPKVKEVAKEPAKPAEPAEESNAERRAREEREELKRERNTNMRLIYEHIKPTKEEPQEM